MIKPHSIRLLTVAVICVVAAVGCATTVEKSGGQSVTSPMVLHGISTRGSDEIQPFVDQVARVSRGSIDFDVDANWHKTDPAADAEAIDAVRSGAVSFAVVPVRAWHAAGVSSFDALIAPMVIDSYALQTAALQGGIADQMLSGVAKLGITGSAFCLARCASSKEGRDAAQTLCNRGRIAFVRANPSQLKELRDALQPVDDWLAEDVQTKAFLQRIQHLRAGLTGPADPIDGCTTIATSASGTPSAAAAIEGRWEVSYTRQEFAAACPDPGEADQRDNWGTFEVDFRSGRFSVENKDTGTPTAGDYVVDGDLVTLTLPTTGELFVFRWSRYRDTLSFAKVAGAASPTGFTVKPWTRIPDTPSTAPTG